MVLNQNMFPVIFAMLLKLKIMFKFGNICNLEGVSIELLCCMQYSIVRSLPKLFFQQL